MFSGSLVAIATPMGTDGQLDFAGWERLIDFHLQGGTAGVVVGGTTGESPSLSDAELKELTIRACRQAAGRLQVIAGAGTSCTATTVDKVRWLSQLPIDGLLIVTPAYNRPTQEGLYRHFAAASAAARVPVIAYNVPSRTAVDMQPATVSRLAQLPRVVAVKEAVASMDRVREIVALAPENFVVLSGDDATAREAVLNGARGVISVTANVAPGAMAAVIAAATRGDAAEAQKLDAPLAALHQALFCESNPIAVKWALARMGLMAPGIRLPLTPLSPQFHTVVEQALRQAGVWR